MARIVAVANQKGGVGKTTTSINLAASVASRGHRVLLVDFDPQGNASSGVGYGRERVELTVYDALVGEVAMADVIRPTEITTLFVAPASTDLVGAEIELIGVEARERILERALAPVADAYDYIVIDCPPSLGILTLNALVAADGVVVPMQAEYFALEGLSALSATIDKVRAAYNPRLVIDGVLFTMYDARTNLATQVRGEVSSFFGDKVYGTVVPRNVRLSEAPSHGKPGLALRPARAGHAELPRGRGRVRAAASSDRARRSTHSVSDLKPKRGLGRGLSALMPSAPAPAGPAPTTSQTTAPAAPAQAAAASTPPTVPADGGRPRAYFAAAIEDVYPSPDQPRRHLRRGRPRRAGRVHPRAPASSSPSSSDQHGN
jgi:chromosome partitioning protein